MSLIFGYCRVSSEEQAAHGISISAQRDILNGYAAMSQASIRIFEDAGFSGKNTSRPALRQLPPVHTNPELNRTLRDRFMPYVTNFFECQRILSLDDGSALADFGKYMEGYEE